MKNSFSRSNNYYFEFIPDGLNFFERKSYVNKKLESIIDHCIYYFKDNKFLYVITDEKEEKWFFYEKAKFFYDSLNLSDKFVLIIENDAFYYGFIDGFPCIFANDFDSAKQLMLEYCNNEFVKIIGLGNVKKKCHLYKKSFDFIGDSYDAKSFEVNYLNEDSDVYDEKIVNFDDLFFDYYENSAIFLKKSLLNSCFAFSCSFICVVLMFIF